MYKRQVAASTEKVEVWPWRSLPILRVMSTVRSRERCLAVLPGEGAVVRIDDLVGLVELRRGDHVRKFGGGVQTDRWAADVRTGSGTL